MGTIQNLALYGTMIEVVLILLMIATIIILRFFTQMKNKRVLNIRAEIEVILQQHMKDKTQVTAADFKNEHKNLEILLYVVNDFDKYNQDNNWIFIRSNFIRLMILPLARVSSTSRDWNMRHHAAQGFTLYSENEDEGRILKLIDDEIPLVSYSAASAGIIYGSEKVFNVVIRRMSKEAWQTQTLYLQSFVNIPAATHHYIDRIMKTMADPAVKATCYNLLLRYPVFVPDWNILEDVKSSNLKLALSAVRYLAYAQREASVDALLNLLDHPDWRMRTVATACLGDLKVDITLKKVSHGLKDRNWWVRFSTRQALQKFGEPGAQELEFNRINPAEIKIDISQEVLNTF